MSKNLVIVESPAKSKTIKKYLGKDFEVMASYGHVRDLIPKEGAVDPNNDFAMIYEPIERNLKHISEIKKAIKKADALYLATDPDREGEAISWHLKELLEDAGLLKNKEVFRVVFHEITKKAVRDAVDHPRELSDDLINAQQARRALDYLVGFNLSPLLWRKIRRGLSAGRVQSPALRLIVERELEIQKFKPREYWSLAAELEKDKQSFNAKLNTLGGERVKQFTITDEKSANAARDTLLQAASGKLKVVKVERKQRKRNPSPPFTTSTLQQEAVRKLGFSASRAMMVAQQLYEGVDIGEGAIGLITYMRTDSVNLAQEAVEEIRELITDRYGADFLPKEARTFKTKAKNAQEAHEAIRPTSVMRHPDEIKNKLSKDQLKLYRLIWNRTVACQMIHATLNTVAADLAAGEGGNQFRANGSTIHHPGFMSVYQESLDDKKDGSDDEKMLPTLEEGQLIELKDVKAEQHFTEPPPRYTEASLVKTLEEFGIGRPSTYASIISTLQNREYVELDKKRFQPTDVGEVVNRFLTQHFTQYVDYDFTAKLEDELDAVSRGELEWKPVLEKFWTPFIERVHTTETGVSRSDVTSEDLEEACPKCGKHLQAKLGRSGKFIGCSGYPDCDYTRNIDEDSSGPEIIEGRDCPDCGGQLVVKRSKYGKFIGCSNYPDCRHIEPLEKPEDTGVKCPKCNQGSILKRKSRRGKIFYSCNRYPDCDYAIWNQPLAEPCPQCCWPITSIKTTKRKGTERVCPQPDCRFSEPAPQYAPKEDE